MPGTPRYVTGWLLLLPAAVLLVTFTHAPAVLTVFDSFYLTATGTQPAKFVGLEQYKDMLADEVFLRALKNSALYALVTVPAAIVLSLLMALLVNAKVKGKAFLRMSFFLPTMLPMIAVANIWLFFYTPSYGLIDQLLHRLFGTPGHNWLGSPDTVLYCMMALAVWKEAGFFMIFYLAALQQMSPSLVEAASIEGASRWYVFRRITFPLLMPTTLFVLINALINSFRVIDHIIVLTRGGPDNASTLLLYYVYNVAFKYWDTSYAATLTVVMVVLMATLAFVQFHFIDRKVHYR